MNQQTYWRERIDRPSRARRAALLSVPFFASIVGLASCSDGASESEPGSTGGMGVDAGNPGSDDGGSSDGSSGGDQSSAGDGDGDGDSGGCQGTLCGGECVNEQTSSEHCGACGSPCSEGELCSQGSCVAPNDSVIPWGEAAATDWADPAAAPDGLIMTEELDAKLFIEQELAAQSGGETAGFLSIEGGGMTFSFDPRPYDVPLESIWHTHPGGTSFSPYDIGNWGSDPSDWGQWATVRSSRGYTFVLLVTDATPKNLDESELVSENDQIRSKIFDHFIREYGHPNDIEASHWSVFEMAERYNWVYYLGSPDSLILERVTSEGPTNWPENPGSYPASVLD